MTRRPESQRAGNTTVRRLGPVLVILLGACQEQAANPQPTPGGSAPPAPWFAETADESGLDFVHRSGHRQRHLMPEIMGGGAALSTLLKVR